MGTNVHLCVCYSLILDLVLWYCKIIVYLTDVRDNEYATNCVCIQFMNFIGSVLKISQFNIMLLS